VPALLERAAELEQLQAWLGQAGAGRGRAVFVSGEAGIGKTALVESLLAACGDGVRIAVGHCDPLTTPRALGPFLDVCDALGLSARAARDEVLRDLLEVLRDQGPTLVVVEDAHWADEASVELLAMLARRVGRSGVLLLVTHRTDDPASTALQVALGDLATAPGTAWLRLRPLSVAAVDQLAAGTGADGAEVHARTGGNPFFVSEVLAHRAGSVPPSVRFAVLARASKLDRDARAALDAVAVVPGRAERWLLDAIREPLPGDVERCEDAGVLVGDAGSVRFRHELAREVVEDQLPADRRIDLHRRAVAALAVRTDVDPARVVHHALVAGDHVAVATFAARACLVAAEGAAHAEAVHHGCLALERSELLGADDVADVRRAVGEALLAAGRPGEALEHLQGAQAHWHEVGDGRREAAVLGTISSAFVGLGDTAGATAAAERAALALAPHPPGADLAAVYVRLTSLHMLARDRDGAAAWGRRAIELAIRCGDHVSHARALIESGVADVMDGREAGLATIRRGIAVAREHGHALVVAGGYGQIGSGCGEMRRYDVAIPSLLEGIALGAAHGFEYHRRYAVAWLARCRFDLGRWDEAEGHVIDALAGSRSHALARFVALNTLGWLRARRGDADAWPPLDEALEIARRTGHLQRLWPVAVARAEAGHLAGDLGSHVELLDEVVQLASGCRHAVATAEIAVWLRRAGRPVHLRPGSIEAFAAWARGEHLAASAALTRLGLVYEAACALAEHGSTASLRAAHATFRRLGALPMCEATGAELRSRGVRVAAAAAVDRAPDPPGSSFGLTARERTVLQLVAAGMTNPQIAAALYISRKTAEHHVSSILMKLGVSTRAQAAAVAAREGLADR